MREPTEHELEHFTRQGVICNLTYMVTTLASNADLDAHGAHRRELADLCERAMELMTPIPDYEEAAREAGWEVERAAAFEGQEASWTAKKYVDGYMQTTGDADTPSEAWQDACDTDGIDPADDGHEREVFEVYAVDDRMAELLDDVGERVMQDFAGHNLWARTTTGQMVSMDGCIRAAWYKLQRDIGEITGETVD